MNLLVLLFAVAIVLFNPEYVGSEKDYKDSFAPLMKRFSFLPNPRLPPKILSTCTGAGA